MLMVVVVVVVVVIVVMSSVGAFWTDLWLDGNPYVLIDDRHGWRNLKALSISLLQDWTGMKPHHSDVCLHMLTLRKATVWLQAAVWMSLDISSPFDCTQYAKGGRPWAFASSLVIRCHMVSSLEICFQSGYTLSPWEFACSLVIRCHLGDLLVVWL